MNLKAFVRTFDLNFFGKTTARLITSLVFVAVLFLIFSFNKIFNETSRISLTGQSKYVRLHEQISGRWHVGRERGEGTKNNVFVSPPLLSAPPLTWKIVTIKVPFHKILCNQESPPA